MNKLIVEDLHVSIDGEEILRGVNLEINLGKVHALMGPNGSGKSTLANVLMGNPKYEVTKGRILLDGEDITTLSPDERAKKGLFLSFQYPSEITGVTMSNFLRTAWNSIKDEKLDVIQFHAKLKEKMVELEMDESFRKRYINEGFSGGEKKRAEILQMSVLEPKYAILDETDSGLDINSIKIVGDGVNKMKKDDNGIFIITHYYRILNFIIPDKVHIMIDGKIVEEGGKELAEEIEKNGFDKYLNKVEAA
ncbi:MAG: Fe-S cluster assembly ATPase SufC [Nanoarchaeota archaeon]|nr:Fe-S cluster assembly ATPase SufC [Nanoarchaeota archaeon]|tara:strand:+ start:134 stop:883 length:750 start_codon:yes stop_codon:yes gene_type:complete